MPSSIRRTPTWTDFQCGSPTGRSGPLAPHAGIEHAIMFTFAAIRPGTTWSPSARFWPFPPTFAQFSHVWRPAGEVRVVSAHWPRRRDVGTGATAGAKSRRDEPACERRHIGCHPPSGRHRLWASAHWMPAGRVPRGAKLMALAIRLDGLIRDGVVADQAELARIGHVTRVRLTQIMHLLRLAPDIQEQILFLPATERGRDTVTERQLRLIAEVPDWRKQRRMWATMKLGQSSVSVCTARPAEALPSQGGIAMPLSPRIRHWS